MAEQGHLQGYIRRLRQMPVGPPPAPWRQVAVHPVGGLAEVGFDSDGELLLVVSHSGRGVFDCITGECIARETSKDRDWYEPYRLRCQGVGPLENTSIAVAGLHGGGLPRVTPDGWSLEVVYPDWPACAIILQPPAMTLFVDRLSTACVKIYEGDMVRARGFSWTGKSLVLAAPHSLHIFGR